MTERAPHIEFTPRDAAKDMIRPYVRRGETVEQLAYGQMGVLSERYDATIGRILGSERVIGKDQIGVSRVGTRRCAEVFSLPELVDEITAEEQGEPVQERLF